MDPVAEFGWSLLKDVGGWVVAARAAARSKAQRQIANVVEHAGILVAGVHKINTEALKLIRPLVYFEPAEWDTARRIALINELVSFTDQTVVVPQMRSAMASLRDLLPDLTDPDIARPAWSILDRVDALFLQPDPPGDLEPGSLDSWPKNAAASLLTNVQDAYFSDFVVEDVLPTMLDMLRSDTFTDYRRDELRSLASSLTASDSFGERTPQSAVVPHELQALQSDFGRLIAAQQRSFPGMPRPDWAFG